MDKININEADFNINSHSFSEDLFKRPIDTHSIFIN